MDEQPGSSMHGVVASSFCEASCCIKNTTYENDSDQLDRRDKHEVSNWS
jgi:hypothetical protein